MPNKYQNKEQDRRIAFLEEKFATINEELSSVKTDLNWLKKSYWIIATASIGGLITALFNLLMK